MATQNNSHDHENRVGDDHDSNNGLKETSQLYRKGVKHLTEIGVSKLPNKYIFPVRDRPAGLNTAQDCYRSGRGDDIDDQQHQPRRHHSLRLPVVDFSELQGPNRANVLRDMAKACEEYGFFQVVNHHISPVEIKEMVNEGKRFFDLPLEKRQMYMSSDLTAPIRYGTSFNQNSDRFFCWRDFLKLSCHSFSKFLPFWSSLPAELRKVAINYSQQTKLLYLTLMKAILESLGLKESVNDMDEFRDGSQILVLNCYPKCPEPELTLGMPPHSDYGFLTLLLQDEVKGLQIHHKDNWITVDPLPGSFVVNIGDHLEIFSNGRYKSVLHRVLANSYKPRVSIASLHSLSFESMVRPSPKLISEDNLRRYKDTNFDSFLKYISSHEHKDKSFLQSRKLSIPSHDKLATKATIM